MKALHGLCGVCDRPDGKSGAIFWFMEEYKPDFTTAQEIQEAQEMENDLEKAEADYKLDLESGLKRDEGGAKGDEREDVLSYLMTRRILAHREARDRDRDRERDRPLNTSGSRHSSLR